jgi:protochlorophyllide reductase
MFIMKSWQFIAIFVTFLLLKCSCKKTVIVTGSNRGIGFATVQKLAATNDWDIVMAVRSAEKARNALNSIKIGKENVRISTLDLADLNSVREFAAQWKDKTIDCLALNAGISQDAKVPRWTAQGFENTVGTNHIGHFYLLNLLLPSLEKSSSGRVVFTGSGGSKLII